jgi:hypothetical protein
MKFAQRPRDLRKAFSASVVITDLVSEQTKLTRICNISVNGCFVPTSTPFNKGAKLRIVIVHAGAKVVALGRVAYARSEGIGIAFTKIEPEYRAVLDKWMSDLTATKS